MCGVKTNVVTAVESRMLQRDSGTPQALLEETAQNFDAREVSADKAYLALPKLAGGRAQRFAPYIPFRVD